MVTPMGVLGISGSTTRPSPIECDISEVAHYLHLFFLNRFSRSVCPCRRPWCHAQSCSRHKLIAALAARSFAQPILAEASCGSAHGRHRMPQGWHRRELPTVVDRHAASLYRGAWRLSMSPRWYRRPYTEHSVARLMPGRQGCPGGGEVSYVGIGRISKAPANDGHLQSPY